MTEWSNLKQKIIIDVTKRLDALGVPYKIITPVSEHGTLTVVQPKPVKTGKRGPDRFPRYSMLNYFMPYVQNLKPGDEVFIPSDKFGYKSLQSGVSSWCARNMGEGSIVTMRDTVKDGVSVLRVS
jgi:hypothetical protein